MDNSGNGIHPFEQRGLGKAPFHFTGMSESVHQPHPDCPRQPGSSCDYCGTGIMLVCHIISADGKRSKVGCDCIMKLHRADNKKDTMDPLVRAARDAKLAHDRKLRAANCARKMAEEYPGVRQEADAHLKAQKHPYAWRDNGQPPERCYFSKMTLADYVDYLAQNGGQKGKLQAIKICKYAVAAREQKEVPSVG